MRVSPSGEDQVSMQLLDEGEIPRHFGVCAGVGRPSSTGDWLTATSPRTFRFRSKMPPGCRLRGSQLSEILLFSPSRDDAERKTTAYLFVW